MNAFSLTTADKLRLQSKYNVEPKFFKYAGEESQIPRFLYGDKPDQNLFIFDIPAHHNSYTVPLSIIIDDNTSIIVFTDKDTKYIIPIMSTLLNEHAGINYSAPNVALDVAYKVANFYLDKIKNIDKARVVDKKLLRNPTKHRNTEYSDHLDHLCNVASGYVNSLADDYYMLHTVKEVLDKKLPSNQRLALRDDLIIYYQVKKEAHFCYIRTHAILSSFTRHIDIRSSHKLSFISIINLICSPSSLLWTLFGINTYQKGFPIQGFGTMFWLGIAFDIIAAVTWWYYTQRK